MARLSAAQLDSIKHMVSRAVSTAAITDIHTHIYAPRFGKLLLWGIDELLTYHYLVAETSRWIPISHEQFWALPKREQADLVWKTLFLDHSPISEASRGVLTCLEELGLDVSSRNLDDYRRFFAGQSVEHYVERVFELAKVESVVMTNDPFDDDERPVWQEGGASDPRFHAALRIDMLLNSWDAAYLLLRSWGYKVEKDFSKGTYAEVSRFLREWIEKMQAVYMAVSLPPTFRFPEESARGKLMRECVLPTAAVTGKPLALMIGVKKLTNPKLRLAGDSVGRSSIEVVEGLCAEWPNVKFLVTMLARENQHELCVTARKFGNLMIFGCWWFMNNPSLIEEITRMRLELLGLSFIPQHSDARVLDQVIYKWVHSKAILTDVLTDKYTDLALTGWWPKEEEIRRDANDLLSGNFWRFVSSN